MYKKYAGQMKKIVLITGCSSGIGLALAKNLPVSGLTVIATMKDTLGANQSVFHELNELNADMGWDMIVEDLDVRNAGAVDEVIKKVVEKKGKIDVLINNAGAAVSGIFESFSVRSISEIMDINFLGACNMMAGAIPYFRRQRGGFIINITSILGRFVLPYSGIYSASKFALEALTESLQYELGPFGIKTLSLELGTYPTNLLKRLPPPDKKDILKEYAGNDTFPFIVPQAPADTGQARLDEIVQAIADAIHHSEQAKAHTRRVLSTNAEIRSIVEDLNKSYHESLKHLLGKLGESYDL
jgi:NAD(P)-dependent dehydrogenase (short-subunit alcohol dehydrogenase family)